MLEKIKNISDKILDISEIIAGIITIGLTLMFVVFILMIASGFISPLS